MKTFRRMAASEDRGLQEGGMGGKSQLEWIFSNLEWWAVDHSLAGIFSLISVNTACVLHLPQTGENF